MAGSKMATARDADPSLIELIARTPAVEKALRERDEALLAERTQLIASLRQLENDAQRETSKLSADVERATAGVRQAEAALRAAQQRLGNALAAKHNFGVSFGRRHDQIETELRSTASPLIGAFVSEMHAAWDKTRRAPLTQETATTATKSAATGRTEKYLKTNASAVARRLRAIHEVIAAAEDLALTEADQAKIPAQLGELAVKLPPMM